MWLQEAREHLCAHSNKLPPRADKPFTGRGKPSRASALWPQQSPMPCTPSCSPEHTQIPVHTSNLPAYSHGGSCPGNPLPPSVHRRTHKALSHSAQTLTPWLSSWSGLGQRFSGEFSGSSGRLKTPFLAGEAGPGHLFVLQSGGEKGTRREAGLGWAALLSQSCGSPSLSWRPNSPLTLRLKARRSNSSSMKA